MKRHPSLIRSCLFITACFLNLCALAQSNVKDVFPDAVDLGEGWSYSESLGNMWVEHFPWIFVQDSTWWYISSSATNQFWAFDPDLGWIWSSATTYPNVYSNAHLGWLAFIGLEDDHRVFYNYWTEAFEASDWTIEDQLSSLIDRTLRLYDQKLRRVVSRTASNRFPNNTQAGGAYGNWQLSDSSNWVSGFFPGLLWLMYEQSGDDYWKTQADKWTRGMENQKTNTSTHDLGFMLGIPFMHAYRLTGDAYYRNVAVTASQSLATRFDTETVGAMRSWSWGIHGRDNRFTVIVDNMMNLEMLFWAAGQPGGEDWWVDASIQHAETSLRELIREDGSTYHLVIFDERDGSIMQHGTHQGYSDTSTWSRGQAWGTYGFTVMYRETGDLQFLETARTLADYFIEHLPADKIPPYDFDTPTGIEGTPKDSSAGAIFTSAMFMLADLELDEDRAELYRSTGMEMLHAMLGGSVLARSEKDQPILLEASVSRGNHRQSLIYADYYLMEAILRYLGILPTTSVQQ